MVQGLNDDYRSQMPPIKINKFELKLTTNRLMKLNEKSSKKLYELECQNLYSDVQLYKDEESTNKYRTGLPKIESFYSKIKDLNKEV